MQPPSSRRSRDPRIIDRYQVEVTVIDALVSLDEESGLGSLCTHAAIEDAVLELLDGASEHKTTRRRAA